MEIIAFLLAMTIWYQYDMWQDRKQKRLEQIKEIEERKKEIQEISFLKKKIELSKIEQDHRRNLRWSRRDERRKKDPYLRNIGYYYDSSWFETNSI